MNVLEIENVEKTIEKNHILKGVNLKIRRGEILSLVGPSGAGKSTLLRCLNRLIEIDKGDIFFNQKNIYEIDPIYLRRNIVFVHQESVMLNGTVFENVSYGQKIQNKINKNDIERCTKDAGLTIDFLTKDASKLSGGEKKLVALARALALHPSVLYIFQYHFY
jgi:ABC-type phosphate transport system ATPase subunit